MTKYRSRLPQLDGGLFLTDGGIETTLIFLEGLELPYFAAFHLMEDAGGRAALHNYYAHYAEIARKPTHRGAAIRSSTTRPISMMEIRLNSPANTANCSNFTLRSTCSAAAAAPITVMSKRSQRRARKQPRNTKARARFT
jgi:S-methylmethionine-dependent homocysteine/selenocysteine methylase